MLPRKGWLHCFEIIFVDHEKFFGDLAFALFLFLEGSAIPKRKVFCMNQLESVFYI